MKRLLSIVALSLAAITAHAQIDFGKPETMGIHTVTRHDPGNGANDVNPGVYVITDKGWTAGTYFNSHFHQSFYAGWTTPEWYRLRMTVGLVTGYYDMPNLSAIPSVRLWTFDNGATLRLVGGPKLEQQGQSILHLMVEWKLK